MAIDFKSLFSRPQPQPITTQVSKQPVEVAKGPVVSSPRPTDAFSRPRETEVANNPLYVSKGKAGTNPLFKGTAKQPAPTTTQKPSSWLSGILSRLPDSTRQSLGNWLGGLATQLPGGFGKAVSYMAKACGYGGGDQDLGATKLPILPG